MAGCRLCGSEGVAAELGVCGNCIRAKPERALELAEEAHRRSRQRYGFAHPPPRGGSAKCGDCVNECELHEGERSPCGLRSCTQGRLRLLTGREAVVHAYHDPLPTNCVAAWVCAGCSSTGYPEYSYAEGAELGYRNLAVFYGACSYDCLFC
ncbi:MAG: radical SAM protein, partial [Euryarchaeota archaeon]|nr:radical SAM protein [Euryarchaeota archaeon]